MKLYNLNLGELRANCYVVETAPGRCIAVDIGGDSDYFLDFLKNKKLKLTKILLTHGHFDHIGGVEAVRLATGAEVYIHADDVKMLSSEVYSLHSNMSWNTFVPVTDCTAVRGDCFINDGNFSFKVIHTPGHSPGSVCYVCGDVMFSGDTLFCGSIGRTDMPGSSFIDMMNSLRALSLLDGDFTVYPGHNESTTLERERRTNPFMIRAAKE